MCTLFYYKEADASLDSSRITAYDGNEKREMGNERQ